MSELQSAGWVTSDGVLAPSHDAAHVKWGGSWRMPTDQELSDLNNKCDWTWTTMNGVNGCIVRGRGNYASNSIFLPACGFGSVTSLPGAGLYGLSLSSVPFSGSSDAWSLIFYSDAHYAGIGSRYNGLAVRPVQGFTK